MDHSPRTIAELIRFSLSLSLSMYILLTLFFSYYLAISLPLSSLHPHLSFTYPPVSRRPLFLIESDYGNASSISDVPAANVDNLKWPRESGII